MKIWEFLKKMLEALDKKQKISIAVIVLLIFGIGSGVYLVQRQQNLRTRAATNTIFSDSFNSTATLSANWPLFTATGTGTTGLGQWFSSGYDKVGGSVLVQGKSDGTPLPGMTQPVANVIAAHPLYQYLADGVYQISGAFMTKDLTNLGAYQLLVMFEHNGWSYQATFHYRVADWSSMPAPNNNPSGIYVYDETDTPRKVGAINAPTRSKQWVTMRGTFDTNKMEYVSIELNRVKFSASGIKLMREKNNIWPVTDAGGTKHGEIHLSTAGKVGSLQVNGYYDAISLIFNSVN